ncbi:MAG TPA: hypothetical protein VM261_16510 [Kofleriaceae bacterium]|nr:hypothetical protein [Kofleriaceae bacterium]
MPRPRVTLELTVFFAVAVVAILRAPGAAGWLDGDGAVAVAAMQPGDGHGAIGVLLGAIASIVPIGELAFRIALLGAVALAFAAAGVVALARALVPTAAGAGVIGAALLATSPAAAATAAGGEGAVIAALVLWGLAALVNARRDEDACRALHDLPWRRIAIGAGAVLALLVAPFVLRDDAPSLGALLGGGDAAGARLVHAIADGTGTVLVFAGLVGLGLGALTGLRGAAIVLGAAVASAVVVALAAPPAWSLVPLALVATGIAPLAGAIARIGPADQRATIATIAAIPIAAIAAIAPRRAPAPDDAADGVARAAADVMGAVGAGPGVFVSTEPALRTALVHERVVAGLRPDLVLDLPDERRVALAFRSQRVVGADRASFGTLDPRRTRVAGRGFELVVDEPPDESAAPLPPPPAAYPGHVGRAVAALLATERARREAARGHLDRAAHAAGLAGTRFGAGDLALIAAARPSPQRPALYGFVPSLSDASLPSASLPELFGDDLAWVAGLPLAPLPANAAPERRLHALWREMLAGQRAPDDRAILALGISAGRATARLLADLERADAAIAAATATLTLGADAETLLVLGTVHAARGGVGDRQPLDEPARAALAAAENALGRAVVADPHLVDARVLLGLVQARLGRLEEARQTWRKGLETAPGHPELRDLLGEN